MRTFLSVLQVIVAVALIASVILHPRKQVRGGIFGGATMADPTATQWSRFSTLSKITVVICVIFMVNSLALIIL